MPESELIEYFKSLGLTPYADDAPKGASTPCITISTFAESPSTTRDLTGTKKGIGFEFRISLIGKTMNELSNLVKQFEKIDNTSSKGFQSIRIEFGGRDPFEPNDQIFRCFYNLTAIR